MSTPLTDLPMNASKVQFVNWLEKEAVYATDTIKRLRSQRHYYRASFWEGELFLVQGLLDTYKGATKPYNVLYEEDCMYGMIGDIILSIKDMIENNKELDECDIELLQDTLSEAEKLAERDYGFYRMSYNPMGAFSLTKLEEKKR